MTDPVRDTEKWRLTDGSCFSGCDPKNFGLSFSGGERDHLFLSSHGEQFTDMAGLSGMDSPSDGRGWVHWDFDRDGRPDVALVNANTPPTQLFRNQMPKTGKFIALRFVGGARAAEPSREWSARDGYGASVEVRTSGLRQIREHRCGEGFASQNSATMLIGLGDQEQADSVVVRWPSGKKTSVASVPSGTLLVLHEKAGDAPDGSGVERLAYLPEKPVRVPDASPPKVGDKPLAVGPAIEGNPPIRVYTTMATWCASCAKNLTQVKALREAFPATEVALLGIPVDPNDEAEDLAEYVQEKKPAYQLLTNLAPADINKVKETIGAKFKIDALPMTVVTDSSGVVRQIVAGVPTVSDIRKLRKLLAAK